MSNVLIAGAALLAAGALALVWYVVQGVKTQPGAIQQNLQRGLEQARGADAPGLSLGSLVAVPWVTARLDRLLSGAGRPAAWPLSRVLTAKVLLLAAGAAAGAWYYSLVRTPQAILLAVGLAVFGFFLPDLLLYNTALKRKEKIALELPDTLDQLSIAVQAGLGFDSALVRVARNGKGPLSQELVRTLQDIQVGQPRRDAYLALGVRAQVPALRRFLRSVVQAEEYGIALADVLLVQAKEMRIERRQRAETKAMKIPVKVVFPLALCILPVLFIVLLGPAALSILAAFSR